MMASSSSSATVAVDKATSDLLIGPDWTMNIDICDSVNSHHWQAKDVVRAVKKRLQHKNPKVQLLALTLLETMVKNCGDYVHFQIAEKNILGEMVKIVKKKSDMHVRDKILILLSAWQEAFGGPGGKHPHYYFAYEELRRTGVQFPQHVLDRSPIFTPPASHPTLRLAEAGYGMPSTSRRLDETMATEFEGLSLSQIEGMRNVTDVLDDMLQAVNPSDQMAVKDEVIADLVNGCRSNQKKLMQMLTTTSDEELLCRGIELNDIMQNLLAKHDAIASGSPMPTPIRNLSSQLSGISESSMKLAKPAFSSSPRSNPSPLPLVSNASTSRIDEDEEEEDDFAQLARRHSKAQSTPIIASGGSHEVPVNVSSSTTTTTSLPATSSPDSYALALTDPLPPVRAPTKEQDMIDLLSLALTTTTSTSSPPPPQQPSSASNGNMNQVPAAFTTTQMYPANEAHVNNYSSYVVPWAQPQAQQQFSHQPQSRPQYPQFQPPAAQNPQYSYAHPPPPWVTTGHGNNQSYLSPRPNGQPWPYAPMQSPPRPLQQFNSFASRGNNNGISSGQVDPTISSAPKNAAPTGGQKPFIPSYRLFEDLNVLGNTDGMLKMTGNGSPRLSGASSQSLVGGRK